MSGENEAVTDPDTGIVYFPDDDAPWCPECGPTCPLHGDRAPREEPMSEGLTEFLLARIAEDETNARSIRNAEYFHGVSSDVEAEVLAFSDPRRILAECEAKRRIVEGHLAKPAERVDAPDECEACFDTYPCWTIRALALPYAAHPDYHERWKP